MGKTRGRKHGASQVWRSRGGNTLWSGNPGDRLDAGDKPGRLLSSWETRPGTEGLWCFKPKYEKNTSGRNQTHESWKPGVDCQLWWGETSSQHYSLWLIVLSPDESEYDRVSERDRLGITPNLTTRDLWRNRRWARIWDFCLFIPVGLQEFFYMP
jgi:hypothetical protein